MATFNELVTALNIKVDNKSFENLSRVNAGLNMLTEGFSQIGTKFTGGKGLREFMLGLGESGTEILNTSKKLKMSTEAIQKWQYAAKMAGVSANGVISGLESVRSKRGLTEKSVLKMANFFKKMDPMVRDRLAGMYGMTDDLVTVLMQGEEAIRKWQERAPIISDEELQNEDQLNKNFIQARENLSKTAEKVGTTLMPSLTKYLNMFNDWTQKTENQEKLLKGIEIALKALVVGEVVSGFNLLASAIKNLAGALVILKGAAAWLAGPVGKALLAFGGIAASLAFFIGANKWNLNEAKELAERKKNPRAAHEKYGEPGNEFWSSLFSKGPEASIEELRKMSLPNTQAGLANSIMQPQMMPESTGTNVGEININIMTDQPIADVMGALGELGIDMNGRINVGALYQNQ